MWEISNIQQGKGILLSFLLGAFLCLIYDLFRLDRIVFKRSTFVVVIEDIFFWIIAAFLTFCLLLLNTNGQIRTYILIIEGIGFVVFYFTVSKFLFLPAKFLRRMVFKVRKKYAIFIKYLSNIDTFFKDKYKLVFLKVKSVKKCFKKDKNNVKNS